MNDRDEEYPLAIQGTIRKDGSDLRVYTNIDFVNYYKWFLEKHNWMNFSSPLHGSHLTIVNEKIHGIVEPMKLEKWDNAKIIVDYSPFIYVGGQTKNYRIFMLRCKSSVLDYIADDIGVSKPWHWHFTVANLAKTNNHKQIYFPEIISIKRNHV